MKNSKKKIALVVAVVATAISHGQITDTGTFVGVGISSPLTTLHLQSPTSIGANDISQASLLVGTELKGIGIDENEIMNVGSNLYIGTTSPDDHLYFKVGEGQHRMVIKGDTGFVGIGTTNPLTTLHLNATTTIANNEIANATLLVGGTEAGIGIDANEIVNTGGNLHVGTLDENAHLYFKVGDSQLRMSIKGDTGYVGIGTSEPEAFFHVRSRLDVGKGKTPALMIGEKDDKCMALDSNEIGAFNDGEWSTLYLNASGSTANTIMNNDGPGMVGIGTTSPDEKLTVNGNIHTKEVRIDLLNWSDFVFEENYSLPSLLEVEQFIAQNGRLQDIPSAKDVETNGILLGDMNARLLQKIEELTLYTIAQEKEINRLKALEVRLEKLESILKTTNL